jgi:hypothetical protein
MKDLPSYEKIVELVDRIVSREDSPLSDFIEFDEFIGGEPIGEANKEIIDRLFEEGYPVGFAAMTPESFRFRVYKIGAKTPSALRLITGKAFKK